MSNTPVAATPPKNTDKLEKSLAVPEREIRPGMSLAALLRTNTIKMRFESMLKDKAAGFISSLLSVQASNKGLQTCDPMSIVQSAAIAASLDLPINPNLGFAHIVPYKDVAQFQMGWRGFVQLAMRSGQYETMNVAEVYEGDLKKHNRITGDMEFNDEQKSEKVVGYVSYFRLLNGFEKFLYMTEAQVISHGKRFSKSYDNDKSMWKKDFPAMAKKTAIKMLLSKWGILSIEMQKALTFDQAAVKADETPDYVDRKDGVMDAETVPNDPTPASSEAAGSDL